MNHLPLNFLLIACALLTSCATSTLWEQTDPHELLVLKRTPEEETRLRAKGLLYRVDVERNALYVQKSKLRKTHDYLIRFFATPVTVAHDAAVAGAIVGAAAYVHGINRGGDVKKDAAQDAEMDRLYRLMRDLEDSAKPRK